MRIRMLVLTMIVLALGGLIITGRDPFGPSNLPAVARANTPDGPQYAMIFLVALGDDGASGPRIGCGDSLVAVEMEIPPTSDPMREALGILLSIGGEGVATLGLYNALEHSDLRVEQIMLDLGAATVDLSGRLSRGGVCDDPRIEAQLTETARQYPGVSQINIRINGVPLQCFTGQRAPC